MSPTDGTDVHDQPWRQQTCRPLKISLHAVWKDWFTKLHSCSLSKTTTNRIWINRLEIFPCKIQIQQSLLVISKKKDSFFVHEMLQLIQGNNIDVNCIQSSDKAHFHLGNFVKKQNLQIWRWRILMYAKKNIVWTA